MGSKRKREPHSATRKLKKQRIKSSKVDSSLDLTPSQNQFEALPKSDEESASSVVFDFDKRREEPEIHLVSSDDDESSVVIESDGDTGNNKTKETTVNVEQKNELSNNNDFIEFGFNSSEDEQQLDDYQEFSDDGVLSNDESSNVSQKGDSKSLYPWIKDHDHSKQKEIADWLTMEMKDFISYISPSSEEIVARNTVISQVSKHVTNVWPETEVHVFGSSATDLYLPGSDIDMVVISPTGDYEHRSKLYQLSSSLRNKKLAKNIEVIAKAKVPIIKFVDPISNIHIDISFERMNGIEAARRIRRWLDDTPGLRELVLIVKQFLKSRKLNNVHVGGLGGYSTIILCYHFLRLHPRLATGNMSTIDNLGSLLIEFFELYGRNFSYDNLIIGIDNETEMPKYISKRKYPSLNTSRSPFSIIIQDPADPDNNITRSSYNLRDIKKAFGGAYQLLVDRCYELHNAPYKSRLGKSILGDIIKFKGKARDFNDDRHKVINKALIDHQDDAADTDERLENNDKFYFSDMTVESEEESTFAEKKTASEDRKSVESYMGLVDQEDSDEDTSPKKEDESSKQNALDRETRRDFWRSKGLEIQ